MLTFLAVIWGNENYWKSLLWENLAGGNLCVADVEVISEVSISKLSYVNVLERFWARWET